MYAEYVGGTTQVFYLFCWINWEEIDDDEEILQDNKETDYRTLLNEKEIAAVEYGIEMKELTVRRKSSLLEGYHL